MVAARSSAPRYRSAPGLSPWERVLSEALGGAPPVLPGAPCAPSCPLLSRGRAGARGCTPADGPQPGEQVAAGLGDDVSPGPAVRRAPVGRADVQPARVDVDLPVRELAAERAWQAARVLASGPPCVHVFEAGSAQDGAAPDGGEPVGIAPHPT